MAYGQRWATSIAMTLFLLFSVVAEAQSARADAQDVSVDDRAEAADAYDQGTSAYLAERYELAAHWFERAYRLVPTSTALLQAVRAHDRAGNTIRAANLALLLRDRYPTDEHSKRPASSIIEAVKPTAVLVKAQCGAECTLELDGALIQHDTFFVSAEVEHSLKAAFEAGETSTMVRGKPGSTKTVKFAAPLPPPPPPIPRWGFFSSLGATVVLGAVTVWSGLDANNGVTAYETAARTANSPGINASGSPTPAEEAQALLEDGRSKERRTNILIGVTAGMAATTAVLGVFTNWKNESREGASRRVEPAVGVSNRGGAFTLKGRF
ncbi:MAG: hypothetical protein OEM15_13035 [Myxococcales bacterium]|nr:hypothetical protein [Myxococcales bacterium]